MSETATSPADTGSTSTAAPAQTGTAQAGTAQAAPPIPRAARVVHYVLPENSPHAGEHRGAFVTGVSADGDPDAKLNLNVQLDQRDDLPEANGCFYPHLRVWSAPHDEDTKAPGTWHWPERG